VSQLVMIFHVLAVIKPSQDQSLVLVVMRTFVVSPLAKATLALQGVELWMVLHSRDLPTSQCVVMLAPKIVRNVLHHHATSVTLASDSFLGRLPSARNALRPIAQHAVTTRPSATLAHQGTTSMSAKALAQSVRVTIACPAVQISSVMLACLGSSSIRTPAHVQDVMRRTA